MKPEKENAKNKSAPKPEKKARKEKKSTEQIHLPFFMEFIFTFSGIFLILWMLVIATVSYLSGASLIDIVIRTGVATLAMGALLWLISWQFSTGALEAAFEDQEVSKQVDEPLAGEREFERTYQV